MQQRERGVKKKKKKKAERERNGQGASEQDKRAKNNVIMRKRLTSTAAIVKSQASVVRIAHASLPMR